MSLTFDKNISGITYKSILKDAGIQFGVGLKILPSKGNLVYEYNPLRNYRLTQTGYLYKDRLYSPKELWTELHPEDSALTDEQCLEKIGEKDSWKSAGVPDSETDPVLVEAGELTDFETNELSFDINHPVDILPQYSYDNSVNLIINDGKNTPRLINSRFSATARNQYQIVDRKGNNDTNIYDQGSQFDIDTSLYKRVTEIPRLRFIGVSGGGRLPIGNYHFYFRYADADGNETDFVAESGLVSVFIGNTPSSIRSGFRNEDSHKSVQFILTNIDSAYQYVNVYYTRSSSDIHENAAVQAVKVEQKFLVNNALKCNIVITGYEDTTEIPVTDINPMYQIASAVETQEQCQNMLFLGNIRKPEIQYQELEDLSLRFLPYIDSSEDYPLQMDKDYNVSSVNYGYYDPKFIYNKVGYWNHELYRLGIVYILSDNQLSPVFNIRGIEELTEDTKCYSDIPMWTDDNKTTRNFIVTEEDTYKIVTDPQSYPAGVIKDDDNKTTRNLENSKGVISLNGGVTDKQTIYSIGIKTNSEVLSYLKDKLNIKGFFFVRQKRIPTILCQAYTIGIDKESKTPVLPVQTANGKKYIAERFLDNEQLLTNDFENRLYEFQNSGKVRTEGAICPDYDVDPAYFNSLFTGDQFSVQESDIQPSANNGYLEADTNRNYEPKGETPSTSDSRYNVRIVGVEDNTKLVAINNNMFSARAGEAEEAFRYEYLEKENKITEASNLIRGSFGPYLGIVGFPFSGRLIDIKIPGYNEISKEDLFKIRYNDKSPFYAISERMALKDLDDWFDYPVNSGDKIVDVNLRQTLFRGDCYICQFTHRLNRNFQDPSAPTNDKIVNPHCWEENYEVADDVVKKENFEKINLGDVNAIKLGMWVTLRIRSTRNLNIRALDDSIPDEAALTGHDRGFYPYHPLTADGAYKTPEALCYNKGFEKSVSERWNYEVPDVPAIKNDFTNRISYSDVHVNDAFKNGFRVFQGTHYRDYPKTYGSITKLVELRGSLLCVFEHGIGLIPVNERAVAGEGSGGNIYINTSNVLPENPKIISDTFGSQWKDSIIKTPRGVYGVDTIGKKIWRTNGEEIDFISDFKVQEFLNQNISLTERELLPVIGVRNVKTHYNKYKGDVMFTFYDNLYGFEERVWNLCYNENLQRWVTFYSWVPSYSENIYNQYFSFDRNTSKWITKLGVSKYGNDFSDGVTLDNVVIEDNTWKADLHLSNRNLPIGTGVKSTIEFELVRDNYKNYELFEIVSRKGEGNETIYSLKLKDETTYDSLKSELYERNPDGSIKKDDERGIRIYLDRDKQINPDKIVRLLNIRAKIKVSYDNPNGDTALGEAYASGYNNKTFVDQGYYESVVAVIPKYNMQFLTTDFWKHGQAGIIDIADKIAPTYWYGKQHPFEFEFVVADNPQLHKIFDNLQIISNKAAPESFHYEIVGECYEFAKDKKNMYIRQEATKELYQFNGSDIVYNPDYKTLDSDPRLMSGLVTDKYEKSTIFPLYYRREDTINEIEDYYHLYGHKETYNKSDKNFSALSGAEIVRYPNLGEYRIWNHAKAVDIHDFKKGGRMRGNMQYKEDKWDIQINPLNLVQRNESQSEWTNVLGDGTKKMVPAECNLFAPPDELYTEKEVEQPDGSTVTVRELNPAALPSDWERNVVSWGVSDKLNKEVKLKDKYIKIRVRYSGKDLAVISALKTLYSISYA